MYRYQPPGKIKNCCRLTPSLSCFKYLDLVRIVCKYGVVKGNDTIFGAFTIHQMRTMLSLSLIDENWGYIIRKKVNPAIQRFNRVLM